MPTKSTKKTEQICTIPSKKLDAMLVVAGATGGFLSIVIEPVVRTGNVAGSYEDLLRYLVVAVPTGFIVSGFAKFLRK